MLCNCLEQSLQVVSNFGTLVESMPEKIDFSLTPLTINDLPPLIRCGGKSVADSALAMLKVIYSVFDHVCPMDISLCISVFQAHYANLEQLYIANVNTEMSEFEAYATM